jgi:hypothetical protein
MSWREMGKRGRPKRLANSPVEAAAKESRKENDGEDAIPPVASIIEKLNKQSSERGSVIVQSEKKKGGSVIDYLNERASVRGSVTGSVRGEPTKRNQAPTSLYKTPPPEGCMRDVLNIAVLSRNEEEYRGTVTYNEAKYEIFLKCLDLPEELLHGIKIQFGKGPNISFKLTEQIDVDDLSELEFFEFERQITANGASRTETFQCKIKGIRQRRPQAGEQQDYRETSEEPNVFNVKVIGCDYSIEEEEILEWLRMYGETFGKLNENFYYDPNPSAKPTGDGTYTVKMRIDRQIPQFLPMHGKKVKIEHRAIQILCTNCYGKHPRKVCKSEKVKWMDYVERFMEANQDISNNMIGKWYDIAMEEKRIQVQSKKPTEEYRRPSDELAYGSHDMQDAIKKVKQISVSNRKPQNNGQGMKDDNTATREERKRYDKNSPESLKESIWIRTMSNEEGERLHELTELGLSMEAARELREQEKALEEVHKLLEEKKRKSTMIGNNEQNTVRANPVENRRRNAENK